MRRPGPHRFSLAALAMLAAAGGPWPDDAAAAQPASSRVLDIGGARLAHQGSATRGPALLVPVRYPLYMAGRRATVGVKLFGSQRASRRLQAAARLSAGLGRRPDRRRAFWFVHRVPLGKPARAPLAAGRRVFLTADAKLDADGDGRLETESGAASFDLVRWRKPARALCASVPVARLKPRRLLTIDLPSCDRRVQWSVTRRPRHGSFRRERGRILYRPAQGHRGLDELLLRARPRGGRQTRRRRAVRVPVQVYVGTPAVEGLKVQALGDSVTAGFGYYADGSPMLFTSLFGCRPAASGYNDACSSNSLTTNSSRGGLSFAPDYGLSNNTSWAAQWANAYGITNYANIAVSGSAPGDWAPGGSLYGLTRGLEADDPDYIVLTLGANPLLSNVLFGIDSMGCALESNLFGNFTRCVQRAFANVGLQQNLAAIYRELLVNTDATILLMQYHLSIPSIALAYSAVQLEQIGDLLNDTIAAVAQSLGSPRLRVITPPRFSVGIDMTPLAPNSYSCSRLGFRVRVDGASVQASVTQHELAAVHFSFCGGPAGGGPTWVIRNDTGIHPSAAGYAQMARALPVP